MSERTTPKISIVLSVFNGAADVEPCLSSIAAQTYADYEIIVVDDCSSDETPAKLTAWKAHNPAITLTIITNKENCGLTESLITGLERARGELIARIDIDDTWDKTKLEKQVAFLDTHPDHGIIGCNYIAHYAGNPKKKYRVLPETHEMIAHSLLRRNPFAHSCVLMRASVVSNVGTYDSTLRYGQDYDLWLRAFAHTKFHNLQEFLCTRIISETSSTKQRAQMSQSIKTRLKYRKIHHYPLWHIIYLVEPLMLILTPNWIKKMKRRHT